LLIEGAINWHELESKARKSNNSRYRKVIDELYKRIAGSNLHPSVDPVYAAEHQAGTAFPAFIEGDEQDEVRNIRRSGQISRVHEACTVSPHQQQPTTTLTTGRQAREGDLVAAAVRDELLGAGLEGEILERAIAIALHFCRENFVTSSESARSMVELAMELVEWDEGSPGAALSEFANELAEETGCYW